MILHVVGLPRHGDERFFHLLYKACHDNIGPALDKTAIAKVLNGYGCMCRVLSTARVSELFLTKYLQAGRMSRLMHSAASTQLGRLAFQ